MINYNILAMQNLLVNPQFSWGGSYIYEEIDWLDPRPKPTKEAWEAEKARLIAYQPKQDCKDKAKSLLANSDWSTLPDVQTQLSNYNDFVSYRSQLRELVINPVEAPVFPTEPEARWK
jgi:hypothetical protein